MVVEVAEASEGSRWRFALAGHTCSRWCRDVDLLALAEVGRSSALAAGREGGEHIQLERRGEHTHLERAL